MSIVKELRQHLQGCVKITDGTQKVLFQKRLDSLNYLESALIQANLDLVRAGKEQIKLEDTGV